MIPSLSLLSWGLSPVWAQAEPTAPAAEEASDESPPPDLDEAALPAVEDPISRYRTSLEQLTNRTIGTASKPVAFNWRRTNVHLAGIGGFLFELNNFDSARGGGLLRLPAGGALIEFGVGYTGVWNTLSSRLLALTPYRQPGRPSRIELDVAFVVPLAEGVVTARAGFFPAAQLVFNAYVDFRYVIHPTGWGGMRAGEVVSAIFAPQLTQMELDNLEGARLDAMQVDPARYALLLGVGNDIYFQQGIFVSPRVLFGTPLLSPVTGTQLPFWADLSLAVGVAF